MYSLLARNRLVRRSQALIYNARTPINIIKIHRARGLNQEYYASKMCFMSAQASR